MVRQFVFLNDVVFYCSFERFGHGFFHLSQFCVNFLNVCRLLLPFIPLRVIFVVEYDQTIKPIFFKSEESTGSIILNTIALQIELTQNCPIRDP